MNKNRPKEEKPTKIADSSIAVLDKPKTPHHRNGRYHKSEIPQKKIKLTPKQLSWANHVIEGFSGTEAAKRVYPDQINPRAQAYDNVRDSNIQAYLRSVCEKNGLNEDKVIRRLGAVMEQDRFTIGAIDIWAKLTGSYAPVKQELTHEVKKEEDAILSKYGT